MRGYLSASGDCLFRRHPANPILAPSDWPYPINTVFNAGATVLTDGSTLLLCRVEDRTGISHFCAARSSDGVSGWRIDPEPTLLPAPEKHPEEAWGIEDPRITYVPELGKYAVAYTSYGRGGPGVSLALTEDFRQFERLGEIVPPEDKDAALLPHRVGGHWALILLARPAPLGQPQADPSGTSGRLVGRAQDRPFPTADRDRARMAGHLPRRAQDRLGQHLPDRPSTVRPRSARALPTRVSAWPAAVSARCSTGSTNTGAICIWGWISATAQSWRRRQTGEYGGLPKLPTLTLWRSSVQSQANLAL